MNSHLCRLILKHYVRYRIATKYETRWEEIFKRDGFHEKDWRAVEREYEKMVAIANQLNAHIVFVHIPQIRPWNKKNDYPPKRLSDWASGQEAGFIDLLPAMIDASKRTASYYQKDGHCTPDGYGVIARGIHEHLSDQELVP